MSVEKERRAGSPRVPFQTLVEVGAGEGGSAAFEAESVDVTTAGLHLRTAYLPEIGEPLLCRLEAGGREVVVQGEVVWRNEDSYGGDFGIRFVEMDQESLQALRELTGDASSDGPAEAGTQQEAASSAVTRGTRVRLHIEGLGSPMKARVRDGSRAELMVGSNLEFLKVGRHVDLENIDAAENRPARIERVSIDVEPETKVPQLVVALRYLDVAEPQEQEEQAPPVAYHEDEQAQAEDEEPEPREASAREDVRMGEDGEALDDDEDDESVEAQEGKGAAVWRKVKEAGPKFAAIGNAAKRFGLRAKDAVGEAVAKAKKRASERAKDKADAQKPRRTTAPPPNKGSLRSQSRSGRKASAEEEIPETSPETNIVRRIPKRAAMIGLVAVLVAIVGVVFAKSSWLGGEEKAEAAAEEGAEVAALPAEALPTAEGAATPAPVQGGGGLIANVPLHGPTPMTTVAAMAPPAAVPAAAVAAVAPPPGDTGEAPEGEGEEAEEAAPMGAVAAAVVDSDGEDEEAAEPESEDEGDEAAADEPKPASKPKKTAKKAEKANKSFGRGRVRNPTVLTLQMNRTIKSIRGSGGGNGFTVDVVGARSSEPAAGLRRRDSRIASARIVNSGSNATLTVRFRSNVPAYRVQADGRTLRILIDGAEKKTAQSNTKSKHRR